MDREREYLGKIITTFNKKDCCEMNFNDKIGSKVKQIPSVLAFSILFRPRERPCSCDCQEINKIKTLTKEATVLPGSDHPCE